MTNYRTVNAYKVKFYGHNGDDLVVLSTDIADALVISKELRKGETIRGIVFLHAVHYRVAEHLVERERRINT